MNRTIGWIAGAIVVVLVAWFIWPTTYRYERMEVRGNVFPVRINRLSGETEVLYPSGWRKASASNPGASDELSDYEIKLLVKQAAEISDSGWLKAEIYNGRTDEFTRSRSR